MNKTPGNEDDHYSGEYQPIDFIRDNDLPFNLGSIVKYLCRHRKKGRLLDLRKAEWYIRRTISPWKQPGPPGPSLELLSESQGLSDSEALIVQCVQMYATTHSTTYLERALSAVGDLIKDEYAGNGPCDAPPPVVDCASER
jgi:hypothetical protein